MRESRKPKINGTDPVRSLDSRGHIGVRPELGERTQFGFGRSVVGSTIQYNVGSSYGRRYLPIRRRAEIVGKKRILVYAGLIGRRSDTPETP